MNPSILDNLTPPQREAVTHRDGPLLVIAGAGSGKTRVVTRRIACLVANGVWPSQILAMTFTNKAAREMRDRIGQLLGADPPHHIGTFHSCCARFLRTEIERLHDGRTSDYVIYDAEEQVAVMKQVLKDHSLKLPVGLSPKAICALISHAKEERISAAQYACREYPADVEAIANAAGLYEAKLRQCNAVDFDDLLGLMATILETFPAVRDVYHNRFRYLLVDEYQDTNHLQYELVKLLTGPAENVHVTGDPDQSIYSWRGADYSNIMNFTHDFPNAKVVKLEQNYRSTQSILNLANVVISNNTNRLDKNLFTENGTGNPVLDITVGTDDMEAVCLAHSIATLREDGASLRDIAVFYRTNSQSRALETVLISSGIPYQLLGGLRFYERKEIKDLLAFIRLRVNHSDLISLERVTACSSHKIGPRTLAKCAIKAAEANLPVLDFLAHDDFEKLYGKPNVALRAFAAWCRTLHDLPDSPLADAVTQILDFSQLEEAYATEINAEERRDNLRELIAHARQFAADNPDATLADFLADIALVADVDAHDPDADFVTLMTLHSSKGLEFPYVFITGVEEGYLPHYNSSQDEDGIEEERRLFYVGITRAQKQLTLLHARWRNLYNGGQPRDPSRFLLEIPQETVKHLSYGVRQSPYRR